MINKEASGEFLPQREVGYSLGIFVVALIVIPIVVICLIGFSQPYGLAPRSFIKLFCAAGIHYIQEFQWSYEPAMTWWRAGLWPQVAYAFYGIVGVSGFFSVVIAEFASRPPAKIRHILGPRVHGFKEGSRKAEKAVRKALKGDIKSSGRGINIHPNVSISRDRETRHFLVLGSTGGGKTVIIFPMIKQVQDRGDMVILFDNKGDITSHLPGLIMAPWDNRCIGWAVGLDIENKQDAETLAARLIPEGGSDPMWAQGARMILVAFVVKAQKEKPKKWDFSDIIGDLESADSNVIKEIVERYNPLASRLVDGTLAKTTSSFLVQVMAFMAPVATLAEAWKGKKKISFRRWLTEETARVGKANTIILQGNSRYSETTKAYIQSILATLASIINSPELPDSRQRRIWLFLDEVPQLGEVSELSEFLEIGRSKGCCVVLGVQSISQLNELYSENVTDSWASMIGTSILCRTQGKNSPKWLSELIGSRRVERLSISTAVPETLLGDDNQQRTTQSYSYQESEIPVVPPQIISSSKELGPKGKKGIRAILHTNTDAVCRLLWPFEKHPKIRPAVVVREDAAELEVAIRNSSKLDSGGSIEKEESTDFLEQKEEGKKQHGKDKLDLIASLEELSDLTGLSDRDSGGK